VTRLCIEKKVESGGFDGRQSCYRGWSHPSHSFGGLRTPATGWPISPPCWLRLWAAGTIISLHVVRERKVYGRRDIVKPALANFIGTLNADTGFLHGRTGNQRFLVCTLRAIDGGYAESVDVHQVWAQAAHLYLSGDDWRLSATDKRRRDEVNVRYMVGDPIDVCLAELYEYTGNPDDFVPSAQVLDDLSRYHIEPSIATEMSVASSMRVLGAEQDRPRMDGRKVRGYRKVRPRRPRNGDRAAASKRQRPAQGWGGPPGPTGQPPL
jgi:hypothetical protein